MGNDTPNTSTSAKVSRKGRKITASARALAAPISTFIKKIKPSSQKANSGTAGITSVSSLFGLLQTQLTGCLQPVFVQVASSSQPSLSPTSTAPARKRRRILVEDEDSDDESSNGDVLAVDSDVVMSSVTDDGRSSSAAIDVDDDGSDSEVEEQLDEMTAEVELGACYQLSLALVLVGC
jgi:hypothetical protein